MFIIDSLYENFLIKDLKRLYQLYKPYFGFSGKNLVRTIAVLSIIASSIATALSMVSIQNAFSALNAVIMLPEVTLAAILASMVECLIPVIIIAVFYSLTWAITSWLSDNLSYELSKSLISKWIDNKSYYGIKFINKKGKDINPAVVLGDDLNDICSSSTNIYSSLIQTTLDFVVGVYQLWYLSAPLILTVLSTTIAIPAYMVLVAIGYSAAYSLVVNALDKNLKTIEAKLKEKKDIFSGHLHHVKEHPEEIALKMGGPLEKQGLLRNLKEVSLIQHSKRLTGSVVSFVQNVSSNLSFMFGLLLSAPGIIAGKLDPNNIFSVAHYFTSVVRFFSWKKDNTASISRLNVDLDRFEIFHSLMDEWNRVKHNDKLIINKKEKQLGLKNISVLKPSGEPIFNKLNLDIPVGKAMVIQGESGVGKTTLFRCLAGLWPYVEGEVILPANSDNRDLKIYYIPQQPYFPYRCSLAEAIYYPNAVDKSEIGKKRLVKLMKELGFGTAIIKDLYQEEDCNWSETLSGGQKQRIAIIGAIIKNPDILFMDEGTNGLDPKNKIKSEKALKAHLKGTTIIAIDHHSEAPRNYRPFFDYKLKVNKNEKTHKTSVALSRYSN